MIRFRRPTQNALRDFLASQEPAALTYEGVGATAGDPPERYVIDRTRRRIGSGDADFERAVAALREWKQFDLGWVYVVQPDGPLAAGQQVAVVAETYGIWWLNACRIVYVQEDAGDASALDGVRRFAFAYGTLPAHAGEGEERFAIERTADGEVYFEVMAFSRPRHFLSKLAYPLMRAHQKLFGRQSADAMERALSNAPSASPVEA